MSETTFINPFAIPDVYELMQPEQVPNPRQNPEHFPFPEEEQETIQIGDEVADPGCPEPVFRVEFEVFQVGIPLDGTYKAKQFCVSFYDFREGWQSYTIKIKDRKVEEFYTHFYQGANYWLHVDYQAGEKAECFFYPKEEPHSKCSNRDLLRFVKQVEDRLEELA